jgi:hypothetical protein
MIFLNSCSLKEKKTIATIRAKYMAGANMLTVNATSTCSNDVWNVDLEFVRTQFHGSMILHIHIYFLKPKCQGVGFQGYETGSRLVTIGQLVTFDDAG